MHKWQTGAIVRYIVVAWPLTAFGLAVYFYELLNPGLDFSIMLIATALPFAGLFLGLILVREALRARRPKADWDVKRPRPADPGPSSTEFGSARWCRHADLAKRNMLADAHYNEHAQYSLMIGSLFDTHMTDEEEAKGEIIHFSRPGHLITIAGTRMGKGAAQVIPNLANYFGSVVVLDIKGENYAITAERRRHSRVSNVFKFAPLDQESDYWNPLDCIRSGDDVWDDAGLMAEMMILQQENVDPFWTNEARNLLAGVIIYVMTQRPEGERTLSEIRSLLTQPTAGFMKLLNDMVDTGVEHIKNPAQAALNATDKLRASILSTLNAQMRMWDSPRLRKWTVKSSFNLAELKSSRMSVYFSIDLEQLAQHEALARLFFGLALRAARRPSSNKHNTEVTFFIDEFAKLGHMRPIINGLPVLAGYGVRMWLFAQSIAQITNIYGAPATAEILGNCAVRCFFGIMEYDTARLVSDMSGQTTVTTQSVSRTTSAAVIIDFPPPLQVPSVTRSHSNVGRPLITPDEVLQLPGPEPDDVVPIRLGVAFIDELPPMQIVLRPFWYLFPDLKATAEAWREKVGAT